MKFGKAVADSAAILEVAARAREAVGQNSVLVVVSAMSGVTDSLFLAAKAAEGADLSVAKRVCADLRSRHLAAARELSPGVSSPGVSSPGVSSPGAEAEIESIISALDSRLQGVRLVGELSDRNMDEIAAAGERLSSILVALALEAPCMDARTLLRTDSRFGRAKADESATARQVTERLLPLLKPGRIAVTQGYIGSDSLGSTTTLGRGGSDYSASLFGAALRASEIRIWTDAEGILTGDPQIVPGARTVDVLGCEEASELVAYGARILHPATIRPALEAGIPVTVRSMKKPHGKFTTIRPESSSGKAVVAIAMRRDVAVISVRQALMMEQSGFLARLFAAFGRLGVSVDLVSTSEICVSVSLNMGAPLEKLASELAELGTVDIMKDRAVIAIVGDMLKETPPLLRKTFNALGDVDIDMLSMGANDINLSIVLKAGEADEALRRLHAAFFGSDADTGSSGAGS
ncbi:MAG: aspartate kinase [Spirochaetae bacterium HGW-Spirochaetae-9]|nr:MAG: aspartate kinase [Spirochaetae bacterium HGW-Spirochaetae-9]